MIRQANTKKKINLKSSLHIKKEMSSFLDAKIKFDQEHKNKDLTKCIVPVNGKMLSDIRIKNEKHERIEEYYKWQLEWTPLFSTDFCMILHTVSIIYFSSPMIWQTRVV